MKPLVLLLRGLNSFGDENIRFAGLRVGPMMRHWSSSLRKHGLESVIVEGMGNGDLNQHVENAVQFLLKIPGIKQRKLIFLGHSTGGLIGRALVYHPKMLEMKIAAVISVATPHQGALMAEHALNFHERHPRLHRASRLLGYNFAKKSITVEELAREKVQLFNSLFPNRPGIIYASAVHVLPREEMSWPVQFVNHYFGTTTGHMPNSDGFVEGESQVWGEKWFELPLDHVTQLGYNFYVHPRTRKQKIALYNQFFSQLAEKIRNL